MKINRILALFGLSALLVASCAEEYDYEKKVKIDTPANFTISVESMEDTVAKDKILYRKDHRLKRGGRSAHTDHWLGSI